MRKDGLVRCKANESLREGSMAEMLNHYYFLLGLHTLTSHAFLNHKSSSENMIAVKTQIWRIIDCPSSYSLVDSDLAKRYLPRLRSWPIVVPRVLIEQRLIPAQRSRAVQRLQQRIDLVVYQRDDRSQIADDAIQNARQSLLHALKCEAQQIVPLKQRLRIVESSSQIADVDAGEGVGLACVSANLNNIGVLGGEDGDVDLGDGQLDVRVFEERDLRQRQAHCTGCLLGGGTSSQECAPCLHYTREHCQGRRWRRRT